ncbi:hypothetical protein [Aestuariimicrobium sp. Y1814]|uniref:hypothetical protein n=1 Tax=Aestuariimicrobium sp. Y1814 TaxID=3418742 RepID=UPI003DA708EB
MTPDPYAAPAGAYDLFNAPARAGQVAALDALLPHLDPTDWFDRVTVRRRTSSLPRCRRDWAKRSCSA